MGPKRSDRTMAIETALQRYQERLDQGGKPILGFRRRLAGRFGLTKQRVTAIAQRIGLSRNDLEKNRKTSKR